MFNSKSHYSILIYFSFNSSRSRPSPPIFLWPPSAVPILASTFLFVLSRKPVQIRTSVQCFEAAETRLTICFQVSFLFLIEPFLRPSTSLVLSIPSQIRTSLSNFPFRHLCLLNASILAPATPPKPLSCSKIQMFLGSWLSSELSYKGGYIHTRTWVDNALHLSATS